jgi:hypothetical protein
VSDAGAESRRFCRQEILPEIGASGQARLAAQVLHLPSEASEFVRELASNYAQRAGLGPAVSAPGLDSVGADQADPWLEAFRHEAPRAVALASSLVLGAMHKALDLGRPEPSRGPGA